MSALRSVAPDLFRVSNEKDWMAQIHLFLGGTSIGSDGMQIQSFVPGLSLRFLGKRFL